VVRRRKRKIELRRGHTGQISRAISADGDLVDFLTSKVRMDLGSMNIGWLLTLYLTSS